MAGADKALEYIITLSRDIICGKKKDNYCYYNKIIWDRLKWISDYYFFFILCSVICWQPWL